MRGPFKDIKAPILYVEINMVERLERVMRAIKAISRGVVKKMSFRVAMMRREKRMTRNITDPQRRICLFNSK